MYNITAGNIELGVQSKNLLVYKEKRGFYEKGKNNEIFHSMPKVEN